MRNIYLLYIRRMLSTLLCLAICTTFSISAHADAYAREQAVSRNTRSAHTQTQCVKLMDWPVRHPEVLQDFDAPDKPWLAGHRGVDLASHEGDELIAPAAGYISFAGKVAGKRCGGYYSSTRFSQHLRTCASSSTSRSSAQERRSLCPAIVWRK